MSWLVRKMSIVSEKLKETPTKALRFGDPYWSFDKNGATLCVWVDHESDYYRLEKGRIYYNRQVAEAMMRVILSHNDL